MNAVDLIFKLVVTLATTVLMLVVVTLLVGEVTVALYMHHRGISSRMTLSEDYGFGMLALLVEGSAAVLTLPIAALFGWRRAGRLLSALVANPLFQRTASGGR